MHRRLLVGLLCLGLLSGVAMAAAPRHGGEMIIGFGTDPEWLDPLRMSSAPAGMVLTHVAEPLLTMTEDLEIAPLLVESWEFADDALSLTLYLRDDVMFHDGTPFNAQAVKDNLERFRDATFAFLLFPRVQEIEVVSEFVVKFHLDMPFAPILAHLTHNFIAMLSPAQLEATPAGDFVFEPVGTGPFVFDSWARGDHVRIVRNDDYWGENAYLDSVVFKIIPEDATRLVLLETGELHANMRIPPLDAPRADAVEGIDVVRVASVRTIYIGFNNQRAPFDDPLVRQAINYAVDQDAIVEDILGGAGAISDAPIMNLIFGYAPQEAYDYNPDKARELLAEAGFPNGFKATFHHPTGRYNMDAAISEAVQAYLLGVGIEVQLISMEWAAYLEFTNRPVEESTVEMFMLGWGTVTLDADYGLYALFHSSQWVPVGSHRSFYKNTAVDAALDLARVTPAPEVREALYEVAIKGIWQDAPWLFLHAEGQINAERTEAMGLIHHPREYILAHNAWLDQ